MSILCNHKLAEKLRRACYIAAMMIFFLFLLTIQMSCGSATGTMPSSVAALSATASLVRDNDSSELATSAPISVSFSSRIDPATMNASTFQVTGPDGPVSGTVSYDGANTATFTPLAPLLPQASYTTTLTSAIKDANGQPLGAQSWEFKTAKDQLVRSGTAPIPKSLFGLHLRYADATSDWPISPFSAWRLWDAYVAWPWLEPKKGEWNFERLDKDVALAEAHGVEIVLPLAFTPTWASARPSETIPYGISGSTAEAANIEDWKNYVRTVASRYKGRIRIYEIWNEPNFPLFYTGTMAKMLQLASEAYKVLKEVDPSITVVSPSCSTPAGVQWLEQYLKLGGGQYADVIGHHFYVAPKAPEAMIDDIKAVQRSMVENGVASKELWNTETGWSIENHLNTVKGSGPFSKPLNDEEASAYVARSYIISWITGVNRFFWYGWDDRVMGLVEADGKTLKPAAIAYRETYSWLAGARISSCGKNSTGTWVCKIVRDNGYRGWIVWNPEKETSFELPTEWSPKTIRELTGQMKSIAGASITVTAIPVLVEGAGR